MLHVASGGRSIVIAAGCNRSFIVLCLQTCTTPRRHLFLTTASICQGGDGGGVAAPHLCWEALAHGQVPHFDLGHKEHVLRRVRNLIVVLIRELLILFQRRILLRDRTRTFNIRLG